MSPKYLEFLYSLGLFNIKLGLKNMRDVLSQLDNPHLHPRIIHIAGTNGKGSTLITLESLLLASGFSTGSTISPHLLTLNERFRLNGQMVADSILEQSFQRVCQACGLKFNSDQLQPEGGKIRLTFFEFQLAMAFVIFKRFKVDYILLETGLGGRLDATNVVENPLACVLTRIALDHQEYLGETLQQITQEKLGILKPDTPVFVAPQEVSVLRQISRTCMDRGIKCICSPDHFEYRDQNLLSFTDFHFSVDKGKNRMGFPEKLTIDKLGLRGDHQKENISTALAVYFSIVSADARLNQEQINQVLKNLNWPGRLEYLKENNKILLDGAHNVSGMTNLLKYLSARHTNRKIIFGIAWMKNKQVISVFKNYSGCQIRFIPLQMKIDKAEKGSNIFISLTNNNLTVLPIMDLKAFITAIRGDCLTDYDLIVVAGSLYLIGEFLAEWQAEK